MIPKILHFIWIGQILPFVNFSINNYKKLNKDFEINFINYTVKELENLFFNKTIKSKNDLVVFNLINNILNKQKYQKLISRQVKDLIKNSNVPFVQLFCDILRLELLNVYGGIYIDCDTFPIKPFDFEILNHKRFCVYDKLYNGILYKNNYFIGACSNTNWENYFSDCDIYTQSYNYALTHMNRKKPFDYFIRKIKFFKCQLKIEDFDLQNIFDYFEHYSDFRWGRNKVELTKFDSIFDKFFYLKNYD